MISSKYQMSDRVLIVHDGVEAHGEVSAVSTTPNGYEYYIRVDRVDQALYDLPNGVWREEGDVYPPHA